MKILGLFLLLLCGCQEKFKVDSQMKIISASISGGRIILSGNYLNNIQQANASSSNLSGYTMEIESKNQSSLTLKLTHASNSALSLAIGTVLSFTVATASAQTTVNLTIEAGAPTNAVMAFDSATCPTGWSAYSTGNGRVIIGSGTGNLDKDGLALTNRILNDIGGRELASIALPASSLNGSTDAPGPTLVLANAFDTNGGSNPNIYRTAADTNTTIGDGDNDNLPPFVVLKYCKKD
jgi:hypothetical protein